jgi:hypothetical protein
MGDCLLLFNDIMSWSDMLDEEKMEKRRKRKIKGNIIGYGSYDRAAIHLHSLN